MEHSAKKRSAFTLVELSVVLVIIGLIVGGILAGQEMIRGSELNRVLADKDRINAAINTYRSKYSALPGDMRNATDFWGTASGGCPLGARTGTQTCNGNGDGLVGGTWHGADPTMIEMFLAMQHMALAGLLQGTYSGMGVSSYSEAAPGINSPITSIQGATFMMFGQLGGHAEFFNVIPRNALIFGATNSSTSLAMWPILTTSEAQGLDSKIDDGKPGTGIVLGLIALSPWAKPSQGCSSTTVAATAIYSTNYSGPQCSLMFNRR